MLGIVATLYVIQGFHHPVFDRPCFQAWQGICHGFSAASRREGAASPSGQPAKVQRDDGHLDGYLRLVGCHNYLDICGATVFSFEMRLTMPNQSPEPTAVGAVRSAVAAHVAGRRWLSLFP